MLLTAVGVFIDVAVITVSPIALAIAHRADISKMAILLAMVGGGKAGNVMSPNPNTIAAADSFHVPLTSLMIAGIVPGLFGLALAYFMAKHLKHRGSKVEAHELVVSKMILRCLPLVQQWRHLWSPSSYWHYAL